MRACFEVPSLKKLGPRRGTAEAIFLSVAGDKPVSSAATRRGTAGVCLLMPQSLGMATDGAEGVWVAPSQARYLFTSITRRSPRCGSSTFFRRREITSAPAALMPATEAATAAIVVQSRR